VIQILSFARCSRALPLCLHTSFWCPAKHTILFPSLLLEYVWDSLRHIITKDNTPRPPLHLSPQQSCSLSQNMFVAAVIVRLPSLSLYGNPQFRNDIVSIYKMISRKWDPYCWHVHIKELNLSRYKLLDTTKEKGLVSFLCRAIVLDIQIIKPTICTNALF